MLNRSVILSSLVILASFAVAYANKSESPEKELGRVPATLPEKALETIEIAPGFRIEQVAAEPLITDPVAMAFDERGRLYVVEMRDYSEQDKERLGEVRILTDEDGDGRFDKSTLFADDLSWPTAITCYDGGVFIGSSPDIHYYKDTTGDDVADEKRVVFTGFGRSNVQGLLNSFQWGPDQRIYGSASSTGGAITRPGVEETPLDLSGRDFAFDPKTMKMVATTGGGQHGMSFNRWGDRFVCHNGDHLQTIVFEERYLARNPYQSIVSARRSIAVDGPQAEVFRASPVEAWREARTKLRVAGLASGPIEGGGRAAGYFTSGTGITVYEGGLWQGDGNNGLVYVADVGSNLIHRKRLMPDGVTYLGERIDKGTEFVRSTDIWFRPVQMAIGPEGALYVADMYREVIEHPMSLPPQIKSQLDLTSGRDRGRIYRITPTGYQYTAPQPLAAASTAELVQALDHDNQQRRMTASRLLFERQDTAAIPPLRKLLATSEKPSTRIAVLYALRGASGLTDAEVLAGLADQHPQVRRHALRLAEPSLDSSSAVLEKTLALVDDSDPVIQFQLAFSLGESRDTRAQKALARIIARNVGTPDIVNAALTSIESSAGAILAALLGDSEWLSNAAAKPTLGAIVTQIVRQHRDVDLAVLVNALNGKSKVSGSSVVLLLKALNQLPANAFASNDSPQLAKLRQLRQESAVAIVREAIDTLQQSDAPLDARVAAIESLGFDKFGHHKELLETLLSPQEPAAIRSAVLSTCAEYQSPEVADLVLARWQEFSPTERSQATELLLRRGPWAKALLAFLEAGSVPLATLDPGHVARLENYPAKEISESARKLRGQSVSQDRQKVFEDYRDIALGGGDAANGKAVFEKNCSSCHQLAGIGNTIGPNLASMASRGAESVLFNILAPSREVEPRFLEYVLTTAEGQVLTGIVAGETSTAVTLRNADNKTDTVLRVDIEDMHTTGKSLMPEGLEKVIDKQSMADLITFVMQTAVTEGAAK